MKAFFKRYGYTIFKLTLNQFAIALFGVAMAFAAAKSGRQVLLVVTSVFSVLFYLFLEYAVIWEVGAKDGISAAARGNSRKLYRGLLIALCSNAFNLLLAFLTLPCIANPKNGLGSAAKFIALLWEGMYEGILAIPLRGLFLRDFVWAYFAIVAPALIVISVGYILGSFNLHATNILIPKNKDVKNDGRPE